MVLAYENPQTVKKEKRRLFAGIVPRGPSALRPQWGPRYKDSSPPEAGVIRWVPTPARHRTKSPHPPAPKGRAEHRQQEIQGPNPEGWREGIHVIKQQGHSDASRTFGDLWMISLHFQKEGASPLGWQLTLKLGPLRLRADPPCTSHRYQVSFRSPFLPILLRSFIFLVSWMGWDLQYDMQ